MAKGSKVLNMQQLTEVGFAIYLTHGIYEFGLGNEYIDVYLAYTRFWTDSATTENIGFDFTPLEKKNHESDSKPQDPEDRESSPRGRLQRESQLSHRPRAPRRDAEPTVVKGELYYHHSQCEDLISKTEAKRRHLAISSTAQPVRTLHANMQFGSVRYNVYRISDCKPSRTVKNIPAVKIDLLQAIFVANKAAKRYRDTAQANYQSRLHGFAGHSRRTKEKLYALKDAGIAAAYRDGRLSFVGLNGNFALYRGGGYCFHSTLVPVDFELVEDCQKPSLSRRHRRAHGRAA